MSHFLLIILNLYFCNNIPGDENPPDAETEAEIVQQATPLDVVLDIYKNVPIVG